MVAVLTLLIVMLCGVVHGWFGSESKLVKYGQHHLPNIRRARETNGGAQAELIVCGSVYSVLAERKTITLPMIERDFENVTLTSYAPETACNWTLTADAEQRILIASSDFSLEWSNNCTWDFVEMTDGDYVTRFCGLKVVSYISTNNVLNFRFQSDESFESYGFMLDFFTIPEDLTDASKCNSSVAEPGVITSPNYPNNYTAGSVCFYGIQAPVGQVVELHFEEVDMDTAPCFQDYVAIYDGNHTSEQELGLFCAHQNTPLIVRSSGQNMYVQFVSTWWEKKGFNASFRFVDDIFPEPTAADVVPSLIGGDDDCSSVLEGTSGTITSPQYPNIYPDNKYCRTMIRSSEENTNIKITFHAFDLEWSENCDWDYLEVFEVKCEPPDKPYEQCEKNSLSKLCGVTGKENLPPDIVLYSHRGHGASLEFRSDISFGLFGYNITFEAKKGCVKCSTDETCVQDHEDPEDQEDFLCVPGHFCTDSSYCENGVCIEEEDGTKECHCPFGYSGDRCAQGHFCTDSSYCENGVCIDEEDGTKACYCPVGYSGDRCENAPPTRSLDFIKLPENAKVIRGHSHTVECKVDDRAAMYYWRYNGHSLSDARGLHYRIVPGGGLFFHTFEEEDEGNYTCDAMSRDEQISHDFTLTMKDNCPIDFRERPKQSQVVMAGRGALFSCDVPTAEGALVWLKDGQVITYDGRVKTIGYGSLNIQNVSYGDNGLYTCRATNPALCKHSVERSGSLTVDEKNKDLVCGMQHTGAASQIMEKISSGAKAENGSAPWHVSLYSPQTNRVLCGASLISKGWLVTAAHCVRPKGKDINRERVRLALGTNDCTGRGGLIRSIKQILIHHEFNRTGHLNSDIALIEMNETVQYGMAVAPICLKTFDYINHMFFRNRVKIAGRIVGCGRHVFRGRLPEWLHETYVPYVQSSECQKSTAELGINITEATICAGNFRPGFGDTCSGDSGGSLSMQRYIGQPWTLVGITSWGIGCDTAGSYGYYTNVGKFYEWIGDKIGSE